MLDQPLLRIIKLLKCLYLLLIPHNYKAFNFYQVMDRFGLGYMSSQKDVQDQAAQTIRSMNEGSEFNKKYATQFLDAVYSQLITPQTSPISKTMTLHVLKQLTYNAQVRFFSLLSSHKTLQFLLNEAKTIDPKKNISEKGLKKFPEEPEIGRQYMKLLMQLTNFWGEKFARGKNSEATKFKRNLTQLKNLGVTLPSNYEIFDPNQYKSRSKKSKQGGISSNSMLASETPGNVGASKSTGKISTQLRYTKDKINLFIADLQDAENDDKIQNLIHSSHSYFEKEKNKFETRGAEVEQDDQAVADYFAVQHFLNEQNKFYNKYIPNNDIQSYIVEVKILNETTFQKKQPNSRFPSAKPEQIKPLLPSTTAATNNLMQSITGRLGSYSNQVDNKAIISSIYDRLESRSKSPGVGFKNVGMQLQKQKQMARRNPPRRTPSKSPNRSTTNLATSTASNSAKIHPIFDNPPNKYVGTKNYEGQFIMENRDLARVLYNIKKDQGSRRFKISNFRQKNPLFQNQHLQVGYKSQAVYEQVGGFNHFILLNIFIGNKTQEGIKQFQVQYKADTNQLLYANPRNVDSIIPAGYQNKHDLMITPLSVPYNFMTMHLSYKFNNSQVYTSIVLPNSVLKFVSYMKIGRSDFNNNWKNARKFKTNAFRLCKHLAPDTFNKWIPVLDNITNYSQFSREGSETDLQMFCMAIMLQKYQAVLKINIRPNLDVVLQLGVLDNNPEGLDYFKFYLESLQLVLKQTEM